MRFSGFDDEWKKSNLGNISSNEMYGMNSAAKDYDGFNKYIRITDISETSNKFIPNPLTSPDGDLEDKYKLKKGDIVFARTGASTGKTYLYDDNDRNLYFAGFLIKFHIDNADPKFIFYNTLKEEYLNWVSVMSVRSGQPGINSNEYKKLPIILPSLDEQNKISNFLTSIDKKIDLLERKHQFYQEFKKFLMQQIFTQKLRFNFNDTWKTVKIKDIFDERSEKGFLDLELLSVTLNDGVIKRSEIESKDNSNENKSNYKHVLPGDIVYNSMRMWQGASGVSPYDGIVSPAYTILIPKNVYSKYFGYYFKTNEMVYQFKKYSQGLTSDTWNLKYPLISEIKIKIPSIEEQKEITNVFEIMDEKIKILQNNIDELTTFKKGLLQQMFVVRINWRCNFKLAKSPSFNKHLLILKNKIIFIIIK